VGVRPERPSAIAVVEPGKAALRVRLKPRRRSQALIEISPDGYISVVRFPIISRLNLLSVSGKWFHE